MGHQVMMSEDVTRMGERKSREAAGRELFTVGYCQMRRKNQKTGEKWHPDLTVALVCRGSLEDPCTKTTYPLGGEMAGERGYLAVEDYVLYSNNDDAAAD